MLFDAIGHLLVTQNKNVGMKWFFRAVSLSLVVLSCVINLSAAEEHAFPIFQTGGMNKVQAVLEVDGQLKVNPGGKRVDRVDLSVRGDFLYDEKRIEAGKSPSRACRSLRHYQKAKAEIKVANQPHQASLASEHRLIVTDATQQRPVLFCPDGALQRDELDLIDLHANTAAINELLPVAEIKLNDNWKLSQSSIVRLLGIDAVETSDLSSTFLSIDPKVAKFEMKGKVQGAIDGVPTKLRVHAKYQYDRKHQQISWLAMSIEEDRSIGHTGPGLDITARLRVQIQPVSGSPAIAKANLNASKLTADYGRVLLEHRSEKSNFRFAHDRRWHVTLDNGSSVVMRMVSGGDLIAQCNISNLADRAGGSSLSVEEFTKSIRSTLGTSVQEVEESKKIVGPDGLRMLRVVVAGAPAKVPVHWIYYHISDVKGRTAAAIFTMETRLMGEFAEADRAVLRSFRYVKRPIPQTPLDTTAGPTAAKSDDTSSR